MDTSFPHTSGSQMCRLLQINIVVLIQTTRHAHTLHNRPRPALNDNIIINTNTTDNNRTSTNACSAIGADDRTATERFVNKARLVCVCVVIKRAASRESRINAHSPSSQQVSQSLASLSPVALVPSAILPLHQSRPQFQQPTRIHASNPSVGLYLFRLKRRHCVCTGATVSANRVSLYLSNDARRRCVLACVLIRVCACVLVCVVFVYRPAEIIALELSC